MGKSCIRFKKIDDLPLNVIGEAIRRVPAKKFIELYESAIKSMGKRTGKEKSAAAKKPPRSAAPKQRPTARKSPGASRPSARR
jgi:hypothetical protein